jgi:hypothetical protein
MATTLTMAGGNLFRVAADVYGDARQWDRIARANGLYDPQIAGVVTLTLPAPVPSQPSTDGVARLLP